MRERDKALPRKSLIGLSAFQTIAIILVFVVVIFSAIEKIGAPTGMSTKSSVHLVQNKAGDLESKIRLALQYHQDGRVDDALGLYDEIAPLLAAGPLKSTVLSNAGSIYSAKGNYDKARDVYMDAVNADLNNSQAHYNYAVTLSSQFGEDDIALKHCIIAVKLNDKHHKGN